MNISKSQFKNIPMPQSFAIVTPNFNMGQFLGRTIESVIRNLRPGDQYFVIDGGSTDNSVEVIRSYEKHLTGWVSEPDAGYADALAKGFERSKSEYMCWINSGDLLLDGAIDEARARLASSDADMIFGDDFYIDEADSVISCSYGRMKSLRNMMLYGAWTPLQDACFWKRELYGSVGGLDVGLKYAADYDLFLRMSMAGRSEYVPLAFSAFRKHQGQKSIQGRKEYKSERYRCKAVALSKSNCSWLKRQFLTMYYWIAVRLRARVLHNFFQSKQLTGESIRHLVCRSYN
jgi:glycosyltransferase involved in cell wall biosynthesis